MACPLPVYMRFNAPIFGALSRPRLGVGGSLEPDSVAFISRSGSGSLIGFSGYRPTGNTQDDADPAAPWNVGPVLKWRRKVRTGAVGFYGDYSADPVTPYTNVRKDGFGGFEAFDGATGAYAAECTYGTAFSQDYPPDVSPSWDSMTPALEPGWPAGNPGIFSPPQGYLFTLRRLIVANVSASSDPRVTHYSTCYFELQEPDTAFDAITRAGGYVTGTLRESLAGLVGLTGPSSAPIDNTNSIPITDGVGVRATALFRDLDVGAAYTLRAWYSLRGLDGRADSSLSADEDFTASASVETIVHHLPVMPGYGVSLSALRLLPVV